MRNILFSFVFLCASLAAEEEDKALKKYQEAELAKSTQERKEAFNEALTLYLQKETDHPSAKLAYNIANTYFQLGEYGYAVLYYYKALKEDPRNQQIKANFASVLQKAGVSQELSLFSLPFSHNEMVLIALFAFFTAFILTSLHIWFSQKFLQKLAFITFCAALLFSLLLLWSVYFSPPDAVFVHSTSLKKGPGSHYATLSTSPCIAGKKIKVLEIQEDGNWMKVRLPSGEEGYVSQKDARLI